MQWKQTSHQAQMFFRYFWNVIASPFVNAINCSFQKGQLSVTQRQSIISVLPKKDNNPLFLKKWRPISLLNCDCKIASKATGNRMKRVLPKIININWIFQNIYQMYAKRLIINLMLCCAFENSYARKSYSNFTKPIFYCTFIIAPLSGSFVERAMRISLKL